jgi:hypothetical protein
MERSGAGNETRTRDPDLGKVVLYQLSYSRSERPAFYRSRRPPQITDFTSAQRLASE